VREIAPAMLFPRPPVLRFVPEVTTCCGRQPTVQKTRKKNVLTLTGPFVAHETVMRCPGCHRTFSSEVLPTLVPPRSNVGYDILVFVGRAMYQRLRTVQEVRTELIARNVRLCSSEIEYLGRKFITCLALAHSRAVPRIRHTMTMAGGYVLHLDATRDGGSPALMTGLDSLSQFVLASVKMPSEHTDHIVPFLRQVKDDYGAPLACVRDMGSGIGKAVAEVFPGARDFICHFHFLRDIGKDFLEPAYARLRKGLRSHATSTRLHALVREIRQRLAAQSDRCAILARAIETSAPPEDIELMPLAACYSLTLWALHGKQCGDGYGFPFDRPLMDFTQRLLDLEECMPQLLDVLLVDDESPQQQPIFKLLTQACFVAEDQEIRQAMDELRLRCKVFDRLREAMRLAPAGGDKGLNDEGGIGDMTTIRQGVKKFRLNLTEDPELAVDPLSQKMAAQIDKYDDKLFAEPITVATPGGTAIVYPQRTNNILEQFFRGIKRGYRRRTGNNTMQRALQTMLAATPLVRNLENPDYMDALLNGKANLEELFADQGAIKLTEFDGSNNNTDRILPGFRAIIKLPTLPDQVIRSLAA